MHLFSSLWCIVVHPKRFTSCRGVSPQPPTSVQHPLGWCDAATDNSISWPHHTPATGGRVGESHRANQVDGWCMRRPWIDKGQWREIWPGHLGYTPTLTRCAMGFLMTTERSGPRLMSHPKDVYIYICIYIYIYTHTHTHINTCKNIATIIIMYRKKYL